MCCALLRACAYLDADCCLQLDGVPDSYHQVYSAALCRLLDRICCPITNTLQARLTRNQIMKEQLQSEIAAEKAKILATPLEMAPVPK